MPTSHLILGCGYLGRRVGQAWLAAGDSVTALTRSNSKLLQSLGIEPIVGDVLNPESLKPLPQVETILYAIGLDRSAGNSMREVYVDGLRNVLEHVPQSKRFIYVSSTGVYAQTDGDWVDVDSPTEPEEGSGSVVLEAEKLLRERRPDAMILRFAGIYGPGRLLRKDSLLQGEAQGGDPEKWLNLIHVDDGVKAVLAAESRGKHGSTYLIADNTPVSRRDFYTELAKLLNAPPATFDDSAPSPGRETNRRISNRSMREELGVEPRYRSYLEGLAQAVGS